MTEESAKSELEMPVNKDDVPYLLRPRSLWLMIAACVCMVYTMHVHPMLRIGIIQILIGVPVGAILSRLGKRRQMLYLRTAAIAGRHSKWVKWSLKTDSRMGCGETVLMQIVCWSAIAIVVVANAIVMSKFPDLRWPWIGAYLLEKSKSPEFVAFGSIFPMFITSYIVWCFQVLKWYNSLPDGPSFTDPVTTSTEGC